MLLGSGRLWAGSGGHAPGRNCVRNALKSSPLEPFWPPDGPGPDRPAGPQTETVLEMLLNVSIWNAFGLKARIWWLTPCQTRVWKGGSVEEKWSESDEACLDFPLDPVSLNT